MTAAGPRPFSLVPRRRFVGVQFGERRSPVRGAGSEVAGSRPYRPGDRVTTIDWGASARLSAARGENQFVVREHFAEQAPRVALVNDRRPAMALYPAPFPWLDKHAAVEAATELLAREYGERARRARLRRARRLDPAAHVRPARAGPEEGGGGAARCAVGTA